MHPHPSRRRFLSRSAAGSLLLPGAALIPGLPAIADEQLPGAGDVVRLRPEIEPLVKLIEDTPREKLLEEIGQRIKSGLSYREVLTALMLAGVRNVEPYPSVGFKFHAVLVVNSAHLASVASPAGDRWLPILWALDSFKGSQARDVSEGNWTMKPVRESAVPAAENARGEFELAMKSWDKERADGATAAITRTLDAKQVLELFAEYAARDFRAIGHKVIYLANAWRTLETIGWEHAEPVLRSLAYAMLNHNGEPNPSTADLGPDRSWKRTEEASQTVRAGWLDGRVDNAATEDLLSVMRTGSATDAIDATVRLLNDGIAPQSVCDALHLASGELLMRQSGIVALHAVTTTNAVRYLFDTIQSETTRKRLLLQNAAFIVQFREAMAGRGKVGDEKILELRLSGGASSGPPLTVFDVLNTASTNRGEAARVAVEYIGGFDQDATKLMDAARRLIFLKGTDSHDYKFSSAALEDHAKVSPHFRALFLASSFYYLKTPGDPDNQLVKRMRAALG